ncbi:Abi-alpha family protein [Salegentibacter sediminis]|uniref:Abi-alpha family protein n=1 Tax=Salegentibacter sediminis TaxID=1930251 RepID=UPI0009BE7ED5|nr:Abi-alpha family protein [Salegentibacter sediminis]
MKEENKNSVDLLGIAPYGEAIKISVEKSFEAAQSVLSRICLPAAEELGLMFQDKVRYWRLNNIIKIIQKSEGKMDFESERLTLSAHPRVVKEIMENGSWCDDETLQEMWAGLIASSCDKNDGDDINLLFVNTLKNLTSNQAKILNYICENCQMEVDKNGFIFAEHIDLELDQIHRIIGDEDLHKIDTEFDNMASSELLNGGGLVGHASGFAFGDKELKAQLEPSPFAIALYVKSKGFKGTPKEYYNLEYREPDPKEEKN